MKRILSTVVAIMLAASCAGTCFAQEGAINVISREDGSGTRSAFTELFGIEQKDDDGNKIDLTTDDCDITNSTSVMMTSVAGNPCAIGYISLGSLNDTVKALEIDGVLPSAETIKSGEYTVARPFNIATASDVSEAAQAFIEFIMSADGQAVIEENGYIAAVVSAEPFIGSEIPGKIVIAGSSSVTPVMEKLREAYLARNPNAEIEIQQTDSSSGINALRDGVCDIGMVSRELRDSELEAGLTPTTIAMDGIAVIVSNDNDSIGLTSGQVRAIYTGEITEWSEIE